MPIYEYQCEACGHRLETLQKISEEPLSVCPECGRPNLQKLVSAAGFRLKGSGKKKSGDASPASAAPEGKSSDKEKTSGGSSEAAKTAET
jgi:putative FmdB family regulatory protein